MLNSQLLLGADFIIPGEHIQVNLMPLPLSSPATGAVVRHGFTWHYGFQAFNRKSRRITRHPFSKYRVGVSRYYRAERLNLGPGEPRATAWSRVFCTKPSRHHQGAYRSDGTRFLQVVRSGCSALLDLCRQDQRRVVAFELARVNH